MPRSQTFLREVSLPEGWALVLQRCHQHPFLANTGAVCLDEESWNLSKISPFMKFGDLRLGFYWLFLKSFSDFVYLKHAFGTVKHSDLNNKKGMNYVMHFCSHFCVLFFFVSLYDFFL